VIKEKQLLRWSLLLSLAASSCSPTAELFPRRPATNGTMVSEGDFWKNLPRANAGDPSAVLVMVKYYSENGPESDLKYWSSRNLGVQNLGDPVTASSDF